MKKFILKFIMITLIIFVPIICCNYYVDPANRFHDDIVSKVAEYLNDGYIVEVPANLDEGLLKEKQISAMDHAPETVIIGSSHVMYIPFDYEDVYNAGMSGSYMGDYYSIVGLLRYYDKMPKRVVIGVDPWAFLRDASDGRQTSITKFAGYLINGLSEKKAFNDKKVNGLFAYSKLKELYSLEYFRDSKKSLEKDGLRKGAETVSVASDEAVGEKQKIVPEGRYVPAKKGFYNNADIENEVNNQIKSGVIYQVEKGFVDISSERWNDFERLIIFLLNNGVEVQLYLPVWHPKVYDYFVSHEEFSGVEKVEGKVRELGVKYDITVHGSYNPGFNKFTTDDFMDWLHLQPDKMYVDYRYVQK